MRKLVLIAALSTLGTSALSLTAADCTRTTHISHGGEADHRDLGEGRVMWRDWWSQEGTATNFAIVDCASGDALKFRTQEDNMNARLPFDRTEKALGIIEDAHKGARVFATMPAMASDLGKLVRDLEIETLQSEPCACAAFYAELQGGKAEFELER